MERIYLDYAASMPLAPEAKVKIQHFVDTFSVGNPSSVHAEGRASQALLDRAHAAIATVFGVQSTEVVLTSGATESNNLAIQGVLRAWRAVHKQPPHVVMAAFEHPSWRQAIAAEGAEVTLVPVLENGTVAAEAMLAAIQDNTALVGCMYVQNELGTIQPVEAIGKGIEVLRSESKSRFPVFHVDAVQAFPYLNTHSGHMHADTVTISGHKYGALSGSGALLVKQGTPLASVIKGGGQEWGFRAGTENVLGAITLGEMVAWSDANRESLQAHAVGLQDHLEQSIAHTLPNVKILGQHAPRAPHITYLWLPGIIDEHIVHKLDLEGIAASSGSACSSGAMQPSATLLAMGYSEKEAFGGIRISYGRFTTKNEIDIFVETLSRILNK